LATFIDRQALVDYYNELGYLGAEAKVDTTFNDDETQVTLAVYAREGPQIRVGRIDIVGNRNVKREAILQEITLRQGEPYSEARRLESQRKISDLGSFRNVSVTLDDRGPDETVQRITISVEEAPATTVGTGGGVEMAKRTRTTETGEEDRVEFSPRAFFEITRRNLGGMNRSLSFFGRVSLQPTNAPGDPTKDGKGFGFSEYLVTTTYRERYAFGTTADILAGASSEQGVRPTFSFIEQRFNADLVRQIRRGMAVSGRYALEFNELFDERIPPEDQPDIDRLFPQVRLSIVAAGFAFDRRNDPVAPTAGTFIGGTADFALRPLGSEIGFVKTLVQGMYFRPLTTNRRVILALRAEFGLAHGFEREVEQVDEDGNPVLGPDGQPVVEVVADLPASQRFYAGGSTSVRGFGVDRLGVREVLTDEGLSNGGNGMVVLNAELRVLAGNLFSRPATVVGFLDAGNVFQMASDVDFSRLRGTFGFGMRWESPVGPLRLDWGRKMSQMLFSGRPESRSEWHFSLGHAF
jgi:outer membrane protein assembly factor BamA